MLKKLEPLSINCNKIEPTKANRQMNKQKNMKNDLIDDTTGSVKCSNKKTISLQDPTIRDAK